MTTKEMKRWKEKNTLRITGLFRICVACFTALSLVLGAVPASADTSADAPAQSPAAVPAQNPAAVPAQSPVAVPAQSPAAVPAQNPAAAPAQSPVAVPAQSPAAAPAQIPAGQTSPYDYVVTDYGVNAADQESDRAAIQAVLERIKGADRQMTVYFPAGDYYIDKSALQVYSNTHMILDEKATIHRMDSMLGRAILHNVDQNGKMDAVGGYEMSHDITLEGGTWDGGNIAKADEAADVIRFDHAENIVMKDCTVKNVYDCHLIEYIGVKNGSITGCTLSGFRYRQGKEKQFSFAREAIQLETAWTNNPGDKSDEDAAWANGSVIDGTTCQQITVSNNAFVDLPCGVGQHHYTADGKYRNQDITISDNTLTCTGSMKYCKTAITCGGMTDVTITGNKVEGPYRFGVHITQADNVTVSDNNISGSSQNGIMMDAGTAKAVTGNIVTNTAKHAISIGGGTLTALSKNTVSKSKQNGISIGNVSGKGKIKVGSITGNTITNIKKHGISVTGGTVGAGTKRSTGIINNVITNCRQNGISISKKGTVSAVHKNKIKSIKNNGISIVDRGVAYWITNNTIQNCTKHGVWNGSSRKKAKLKGNKGKTK